MFLIDLLLEGSGAVVSGGDGNITLDSSSPVVIIVDIDEFDKDNDEDDCHENEDELLEQNDDDDPTSCICDVDCIIFLVCDSREYSSPAEKVVLFVLQVATE